LEWSAGELFDTPPITFVMLNPSTADEADLDPTLRRCRGFTLAAGFSRFVVLNLFAIRGTDPKILRRVRDPVGPENDDHLRAARDASRDTGAPIVVAWGGNPAVDSPYLGHRGAAVLDLLGPGVLCLGTTFAGFPRHPLYVRADQSLVPYHAKGPA
jgi:hypothetical protein